MQQGVRYAEQHAHDAVLAAGATHSAVIAIDGHRAGIGAPLIGLVHLTVLSIGVGRTVTGTTDISSVATSTCRSQCLPSAHGPAQLRRRRAAALGLASESLRDTTFVVVDLETTGGRASGDGGNIDAITEIGAVKVRGGAVLGELATLVDPGRSIPPQIVELTGITSAMVRDAPKIDTVLPAFLEFARGAVLVAHNAGFDIGFLRAAAERCQIAWPRPPVLCTVRLARRVLTRDEAPSVRLSALARLFGAATTPTHRALDDARATVDVLHALIERVGNQGVHTYTDLRSYLPDVSPQQRRKRVLAADLPHRPGVYLFRGPANEVLYVGTAVDLRRRAGQYFNGSDLAAAHQGDGRAGHRGRPRRVRARPGGGRA